MKFLLSIRFAILLLTLNHTLHHQGQGSLAGKETSYSIHSVFRTNSDRPSYFRYLIGLLPHNVWNKRRQNLDAISSGKNKNNVSIHAAVLIIILLSGDIEINPGPNSIYPCGICENKVDWSCKAIACDECDVWYHQSCTSMSSSAYQHHVLNASTVWVCFRCGNPNYAGSFTFKSYELETSNSFSLLEPSESISISCSPEIRFNPKHTSSPSNSHGNQEMRPNSTSTNNLSSNASDVPAKGKNWRTLSLNINSLPGKKDQLALAVEYLKPDVIIGCESKITNDIKNAEVFPRNYRTDVFRKDRDGNGGGVFLAFRDGYNPSEIKIDSNSETIWAKVPMKKGPPLKLCSFYRPPNSGPQPIIDLSNQVSLANEKGNTNLIIAGDFNCRNIDWSIPKITSGAMEKATHQQLLDLLTDHCLTNIQHENTRETSNLDLYLTSNTSLIKSISVIPGLSDHEMIVVDTELSPTFNKSPPRYVSQYHKADWESIKNQTIKFSSEFLEKCQKNTVNHNWNTLKEHLELIIKNEIPSKLKTTKNRSPWITTEILRLIRKKKRAYKNAKRKNRPNDWSKYREIKKLVNNKIRQSHGKFIENTLTTTLEEGNTKPFWAYIKSRKQDTCGIAPLKSNGHLETDSRQKAELLSKQFSSVFTKDKTGEIPKTGGEEKPSMEPITITPNGVEKLLQSINTSKANGPDGIPNMLLKNLATELTPPLTYIFNQSLKSGEIPQDWKKANITPIYKKDDKHSAANYRPVSLTCVCSKLMEHIIVSHLMKHLEKHNILTDNQHGFRRHRSCITQLHLTTSDLTKYYDRNTQVDMCILDFSKAFDVVSHKKLLAKLNHYGIRNNVLKWIGNFLSERQQSVVVDGISSKPAPVLSGVPQGTCLGPILFLCYINDIGENISSQIRLFADDALLYRPIHSLDDQQMMQNDLDKLQSWATCWNMKFNSKKCYIMSFKRSGLKHSKFYTLGGEILETVKDNPYLGVLLSDDTTFTAHINKICSKTSRTIGFLNRNLKHCPSKLRNMAYISMCRSTLEYASQIWDPFIKKEINELEKVQRKAARMVLRKYKQESVTKMLEELNWEPLEERRRKARLIFLYQIIHKEIAIPLDTTLLKEGRRGRYKHLSHQHVGYTNSFYPRTIREWNELPPSMRNSHNLDTFKAGLCSPHVP